MTWRQSTSIQNGGRRHKVAGRDVSGEQLTVPSVIVNKEPITSFITAISKLTQNVQKPNSDKSEDPKTM